MHKRVRSSVAFTLLIVLPLSFGLEGCVTTSGSAALTPAEQQLRQTETSRLGQGIFTGAAVGALTCGLMAALSGGNGRRVAGSAAVCGVAGGVAGGLYANNVNQRARPYAERQSQYDDMIKGADANLRQYRKMASAADNIASAERAKISRLNTQLAAGNITASQYRAQLASARSNISALDRQISNASADVNDLTRAINAGGPSSLSSRKTQLEQEKATLENRKRRLVETYRRVPDSVGLGV